MSLNAEFPTGIASDVNDTASRPASNSSATAAVEALRVQMGGELIRDDTEKERRHLLIQCLSAEAIATFLLLYVGLGGIICSAVLNNETISVSRVLFVSLCYSMAYAALLYALSFNSAHNDMSTRQMNPVLSLCLWILKRMTLSHFLLTLAAQIVGGGLGVGALYLSTPKRAFHYSTVEGVTPWQELIMSSIVSFIALFVLLITNFHHEDRREKIRLAKLAIHKRTKAERDRLKRGVYGDQSTKQAKAAQQAKANRRGTQISFGNQYNDKMTSDASALRSYRLDQLPQSPLPVLPLGVAIIEDDTWTTYDGQSGSTAVNARRAAGGAMTGVPATVVHGPISATRPTTQSVDEYHCMVCCGILFVCTVVGSAISGGFMNPLFVAGVNILALRVDVIPLLGPLVGAGFAVLVAWLFGESANLMNTEKQLALLSNAPVPGGADAAESTADAPRGERRGVPGARAAMGDI